MSFQNPAGLWLLLGVPVLILIWLIKPQHEDRRVSSSYIWKLSERFMKRRLPLSRFRKWLVFLLQLLLVAGGAFIAARPVLARGTQTDYLVILDASASMRTVREDGRTRFDAALEQIGALAKETSEGHTLSVIAAGEEAGYVVSEGASPKEIAEALRDCACGWGECSLSGAMTLAQLFLYRHPGAQAYFYTDHPVGETKGIEAVDFSNNEWNVSLTSLSAVQDGEGGVRLSAALTSWGRDADVAVGLLVNGRLTDAVRFSCEPGIPQQVGFEVGDMTDVISLELAVDPGDALEEDNRLVYYPENERPCDALLVTETPLYLETALDALRRGKVGLAAPQSNRSMEGYDLVVFDGILPSALPEAGAILLIDPPQMPDGIEASGKVEETGAMTASAAGSAFQDKLLRDMKLAGVSVARHTVTDASDEWTTVCSIGQDPVLLARTLDSGCVAVVLLFDLHDSNLPLMTDFLSLIRNVMNLAVPSLLDRRLAYVGESVTVTLLPTSEPVRLTAPDGSVTEIAEAGETKLEPALPGAYTLLCGGEETGFFVAIPEAESAPETLDALSLTEMEVSGPEEDEEAASGLWRWLAGILLVILLAEWGIYLYEQL